MVLTSAEMRHSFAVLLLLLINIQAPLVVQRYNYYPYGKQLINLDHGLWYCAWMLFFWIFSSVMLLLSFEVASFKQCLSILTRNLTLVDLHQHKIDS